MRKILNPMHNYKHISSATSTDVKDTTGKLLHITVNSVTAGATATVYDSLSGTGQEMAVITPTDVHTLDYDIPFEIGLYIVTTGTADYTVVYD